MTAPAFDADWASPSDWVGLYRSRGLQVVPCHRPIGPKDLAWKHPKLATWKEFASGPVPDPLYERWYGPSGEFAKVGRWARSWARLRTGSSASTSIRSKTRKPMNGGESASRSRTTARSPRPGRRFRVRRSARLFQISGGFRHADGQNCDRCRHTRQGGFIVLPPTMHNNGRAYEWEDRFAPWQTDIAVAPEWLIVAIEETDPAARWHRQGP